MASALTRRGSTRRWRVIRRRILVRDEYRCQFPIEAGRVCGEPANTVGHIIRREHGGSDNDDNLRAECGPHNYGTRADNHYRAEGW